MVAATGIVPRALGLLADRLLNLAVQGKGVVSVSDDGPPMFLDCSQQPTFFDHQMSKTTAPLRGQRCVSVGHEGLRSAMRMCQPTSCRRPSHNLSPVHNLPRKYS